MPNSRLVANDRRRVLGLVRALVNGLTASARAVERRTGVTNAQLFLLRELATHGPLAVGALAVRARTQPSTASIVVARLVRAGLVSKVRSTEDRRRAVVRLTAKGRRVVHAAPTPPTSRLLQALDGLTERECAVLAGGLAPLVAHLGFAAEHAPMLFEGRAGERRPR